MARNRNRNVGNSPRDPQRERLHTEAPTLAGDASTGRDTASRGNTGRPDDGNVGRDLVGRTGPITKIGRIFGAAAAATALVAGLALGAGAATPAARPNDLAAHGRVADLDLGPTSIERVALAATPDGRGVFALDRAGRVVARGEAIWRRGFRTDPAIDPAIGIAAASNRGYWIVTRRGRVRALGNAPTLGEWRLPRGYLGVAAIAARPDGDGYWIVRNDGRVRAFGDAPAVGYVATRRLRAPIVAASATADGAGLLLLASDGAVYPLGTAERIGMLRGVVADTDAVGIAADRDGDGYSIALRSGLIAAFDAGAHRGPLEGWRTAQTVAIAVGDRGAWTLQGRPRRDIHLHPFLVCTRSHESSHNAPAYDDGYAAVNPSGTYRGAYQFSRSTWDSTARHAGRNDLVGVDPARASVADQDLLALDLYQWQGAAPWMGRCA